MYSSLLATLLLLPLALADGIPFQGFFPITSPSSSQQWIVGETNTLSWNVGALTNHNLPPSFDVTMQDPFSLKGPLRIVSQVPLQSKAVAVQLGDEIPTSDNYRLVFSDTWSGQIFAQSDKFSVVAKGSASPPSPPNSPTVTVNGFGAQFAATLAGPHLPTGTDPKTGKILGVTGGAVPTRLNAFTTSFLGLIGAGVVIGVVGVVVV